MPNETCKLCGAPMHFTPTYYCRECWDRGYGMQPWNSYFLDDKIKYCECGNEVLKITPMHGAIRIAIVKRDNAP